jgi:hypothetical protein
MPGGICGAACAAEPERERDDDFGFDDDFDDDFEADFDDDDDDDDDDGREAADATDATDATDAATDACADCDCTDCDGAGCGAGCGPEPDAGVVVCGAGSSGRWVPGRGMRCGRPGGVGTLPGSVGTRGAALINSPQRCALLRGPAEPDLSIRLREIERLLSRLTATRLCGSGKCGAAGSFAGSPRARVDDEDEWMLPARAGNR